MLPLASFAFALILQATTPAPPPAAAPASPAPTAETPKAPAASDLLHVKRIFVDSFGDDGISKQIQAMVVTEITESKQFIVTENKDRADGTLRGAGLEKTSQEVHAYSEATAVGGAAAHSDSVSGRFVSRNAAIDNSSLNTETINDARIAVRLVNQDGDVLWATTQESKGGKYKGASADVADQVVKQLLRDFHKLQNPPQPTPSAN